MNLFDPFFAIKNTLFLRRNRVFEHYKKTYQIRPIFFIQTLLSVSELHRFDHFQKMVRGLLPPVGNHTLPLKMNLVYLSTNSLYRFSKKLQAQKLFH